MCKILKENGLNIMVKCNLAITDFRDDSFYLKSGTCYPYTEAKSEILSNLPLIIFTKIEQQDIVCCKQSNHPPCIRNQIRHILRKR